MISPRVYGSAFPVENLLDTLQHARPIQVRAAAARVIYWDFSFNFGNDRRFFANAHSMISHGGISLLLSTALTCLGHVSSCRYRPSRVDYARDSSHRLVLRHGDCGRPLLNYSLCDTPFIMPSYALSYHSATLIGDSVEHVTLRQLAVEVISEMSNYAVYRGEICRVPGAIASLIELTRRYGRRLLFQVDQGCDIDADDSGDLFMLDRLVNMFANMCLDGRSWCSGDGGWQFSASECFSDGDIQLCTATRYLPCYIMDELAGVVTAVGEMTRCTRTLRNLCRLVCNAVPALNERIMYRLARYDVESMLQCSLQLFASDLAEVEDLILLHQDQDIDMTDEAGETIRGRLESGIRIVSKALIVYRDGMSRLYSLHRLTLAEMDRLILQSSDFDCS